MVAALWIICQPQHSFKLHNRPQQVEKQFICPNIRLQVCACLSSQRGPGWAAGGGQYDASVEVWVFQVLPSCSFALPWWLRGLVAIRVFSCCVRGADWPSSYLLVTQKENQLMYEVWSIKYEGLILENNVKLVLYTKHLTFVNQSSKKK